jgi:hypothetical protein
MEEVHVMSQLMLRRVERVLAGVLMCGLMVTFHLLPARQHALARELESGMSDQQVGRAKGWQDHKHWCLPVPIPPELQRMIDTWGDIYRVLFARGFGPCDDTNLLFLDEPLDGSVLPVLAAGRSGRHEGFGFEALIWFEPDFSELPPEEQRLLEEWGVIAGTVIGQIRTGSGAVAVLAHAVSFEPPDKSWPRMNLLVPLEILPQDVWEALHELYGGGVGYRHPCPEKLEDEQVNDCLDKCWENYREGVDDCVHNLHTALKICGSTHTLSALIACLVAAIKPMPATLLLCLYQGSRVLECYANAAIAYAACIDRQLEKRERCFAKCCGRDIY